MKAVVDAVLNRLAANWTDCPVIGPNKYGPADGSAFVAVQFPVANSEQVSIGAPGAQVWREEGAIRLVLNVGRGVGPDTGLDMADRLASLFRGQQFDGVSTWAPSSPVIDDQNGTGNYWRLSFAVPYYYDLIG